MHTHTSVSDIGHSAVMTTQWYGVQHPAENILGPKLPFTYPLTRLASNCIYLTKS